MFERFASLHDVHILAQRVQLIPVDGAPEIRVETRIDTHVTNNGARHWLPETNALAEGDLLAGDIAVRAFRGVGQHQGLAALDGKSGPPLRHHEAGAGIHVALRVREQGIRAFLPVEKVRAGGMAPVHVVPAVVVRIVLVEKVPGAVLPHQAVRVIQPAAAAAEMVLRA